MIVPSLDRRDRQNDRVTNHIERVLSDSILDQFSLEVAVRDAEKLRLVADTLPANAVVSIPFLPVEDNGDRIAAAGVVRSLGFEPMPHISARRIGSQDELEQFLEGLAEQAKVRRLLVVAGDPSQLLGPYSDSVSVLRSGLLERYGISHVAVAGHPEGHPHINAQEGVDAMRLKQSILTDLGIDWSIVTQFAFSSEPVLEWIKDMRQNGFAVPIHVGVPGPATVKTLLRFAAICGVGASTSVMRRYGLSITKLLSSAGPDGLVDSYRDAIDPQSHGNVRLHFYPFGGLIKVADWIRDYSASSTSNMSRD